MVLKIVVSKRITPAYAGNTIEYEYMVTWMIGLPPPTRGTPDLSKDEQQSLRITPAYAGNTPSL